MSQPPGPHLTFLTRAECHLCAEALVTVQRVAREESLPLEIIDVDTRADLAERHGMEVPVLLVDGVKLFKFRVDRKRLQQSLRARRGDRPSTASLP